MTRWRGRSNGTGPNPNRPASRASWCGPPSPSPDSRGCPRVASPGTTAGFQPSATGQPSARGFAPSEGGRPPGPASAWQLSRLPAPPSQAQPPYRERKGPADAPGPSSHLLAERGRFELPVGCPTPLFESGTINHSDTSPPLSLPAPPRFEVSVPLAPSRRLRPAAPAPLPHLLAERFLAVLSSAGTCPRLPRRRPVRCRCTPRPASPATPSR